MSALAEATARWQDQHARFREHFDDQPGRDHVARQIDQLLAAFVQLDQAQLVERGHPCAEQDFAFEPHIDLEDGEISYRACLHGVALGEVSLHATGAYVEPVGWDAYIYEPLAHDPDEMPWVGPQPHNGVLLQWLRIMTAPETIERVQAEAAALCLSRLRHCAALGGAGWEDFAARAAGVENNAV